MRRWPRRLRVGAAALAILAALCTLGPMLSADPDAIVDPPAAGLLPPLTARWVVTLADGSTRAAENVAYGSDGLTITRAGKTEQIPAGEVSAVHRRVFWFGTDTVGRDVLARVLAGGRISLLVGCLALAAALVVGVSLGLAAGWWGGVVDVLVMRIVDALLAIPMLFLLILIAALFRPSLTSLILVLGASSWMGVSRLTRGQVLSLKQREYILAARSLGAGPWRIALRHLLPNSLAPLTQDASLRLGDIILVEASLSYLGLGVQPPMASWGNMVSEGQVVLPHAWWITFLPGLGVTLTVIAAALVADGVGELVRGERTL